MQTILNGDCLAILPTLPDQSVQCVVTSPPYYNLRDYQTGRWEGGNPDCDHRMVTGKQAAKYRSTSTLHGGSANCGNALEGYGQTCGKCGAIRIDDQIGVEESPAAYVAKLVEVFREVRRVLRDDGTIWINIGDSYNNRRKIRQTSHRPGINHWSDDEPWVDRAANGGCRGTVSDPGLKEKDLMMIPARVAIALCDDGWYLRSDIIWHKRSVLPESALDRPTNCYEHVFLLSKQRRYFYDQAAIREPNSVTGKGNRKKRASVDASRCDAVVGINAPGRDQVSDYGNGRNCRNVWQINRRPYKGSHYATMPVALAERCILAGSRIGDVILDPFAGAGTSGLAAQQLGRDAVLIELSAEYCKLMEDRLLLPPMFRGVRSSRQFSVRTVHSGTIQASSGSPW